MARAGSLNSQASSCSVECGRLAIKRVNNLLLIQQINKILFTLSRFVSIFIPTRLVILFLICYSLIVAVTMIDSCLCLSSLFLNWLFSLSSSLVVHLLILGLYFFLIINWFSATTNSFLVTVFVFLASTTFANIILPAAVCKLRINSISTILPM